MENIRVYAFVGPSGTGKSYRAQMVANENNINYIIDDGLFIISSTFKPEKMQLVEKEIFDEIQKIKNGAITKEDVQKAKNMIK